MQELALEAELAGPAVHIVAGDRQVDCCEMNANLMGSACLEADLEQSVARQQLHELEVGDRSSRCVRVERVPHGVPAVAADRRFNPAAA